MADQKRSPWMKWYPRDLRGDGAVRMCGWAARGLWIDLLGLMHDEGEPYGHLTIKGRPPTPAQLANMLGGSAREITSMLAEMEAAGVFSKTDDGVIFSRRMIRDRAKAERDRINGNDGGNPDIPRGLVPKEDRARPFKRSDSPQKTERIFNRAGGCCHWCGIKLLFVPDGGPTGFHVDHIVAVCDGGTNDENNLVAACARCNHDRARMDAVGRAAQVPVVNSQGVPVGSKTDSKAQKPEARSQKPRPEKESLSKGGPLALSRAQRPNGRGLNLADKQVRKQVWEQKVMTYIRAHYDRDEAEKIILAYVEGKPAGKTAFENADRAMRGDA